MAFLIKRSIKRLYLGKHIIDRNCAGNEASLSTTQRRIWWKEAVVYEIYWESFVSSPQSPNAPAVLVIIDKLEYLRDLGVDIIWLTPMFISPRTDSGYDVADFYAIDPKFGTHETFIDLVSKAREHGISIMLDMVFNHVSDQHEWFVEASQKPASKYEDYFLWAKTPLPGVPSFFSKSAWLWVPDRELYVRHSFSEGQIDLNWENSSLRSDLSDVLRFWLLRGVRGFRFDVINFVDKKPNKPDLQRWLAELTQSAFGEDPDVFLVGECPGITPTDASNLTRSENQGLNVVLHTDLTRNMSDSSIPVFTGHQKIWQDKLNSENCWNSLCLGSHDTPRVNSRYGNDSSISAKLFGAVLILLKGTPFIYQHEELGTKNVVYDAIEHYHDIETLHKYREHLENGMPPTEALISAQEGSRDGARGPLDWNDAAKQRKDPLSVFSWFKRLISLRKQELDTLVYGNIVWLPVADSRVFCFARTTSRMNGAATYIIVVVLNLSNYETSRAVDFKDALRDRFTCFRLRSAEILLSNYEYNGPIKRRLLKGGDVH